VLLNATLVWLARLILPGAFNRPSAVESAP
jgi:hypothetical protein